MGKKKKELYKAGKAVFGGAMAMQAAPMLSSGGRTVPALVAQLGGFVGIGTAGVGYDTAYKMASGEYGMKHRKKIKRK